MKSAGRTIEGVDADWMEDVWCGTGVTKQMDEGAGLGDDSMGQIILSFRIPTRQRILDETTTLNFIAV